MTPEQPVQAAIHAVMDRIQREYARLIDVHSSVSLLESFNSDDLRLESYCQDYHPHPQTAELVRSSIGFGRSAGILLPNAEHYLTCALYLFPDATPEKILLIARNYAVDFYLNDTMGREYRSTSEERQRLNDIRARLTERGAATAAGGPADAAATAGERAQAGGPATPAERAHLEVLTELSNTSPASWFDPFLALYLKHLSVAHKSYDCLSLGTIPRIEEYIAIRADISGMPHTVSMVEYSQGNYLDWPLLQQIGLAGELRELGTTVSLIGALMNDLFSFEKEVIDNRSDSNLLAIIVLNNFRMELREAMSVGTTIVRNLLAEYARGAANLLEKIERLPARPALAPGSGGRHGEATPDLRTRLLRYMEGIRKCVQTCWLWQVDTQRYKRPRSIWKETALSSPVVV